MGYLLPVDGEREDIPATGISMGTVRELADALPAKHVLFLLDVCFGGIAGTLTRSSPPAVTEAYLKQITRERGRHLITAGGANQEVIESAQWGHSVFTYFLLKGLNEGLADQDDNGVITAQELYTYLEPRVFGEAQQQGHTQTPQMSELTGEKGQFVFFTSATGKPKVLSTTPKMTETSSDEMEAMKKRLVEMEKNLAEQSKGSQPAKRIETSKPIEEVRARPYGDAISDLSGEWYSRDIVEKLEGIELSVDTNGAFELHMAWLELEGGKRNYYRKGSGILMGGSIIGTKLTGKATAGPYGDNCPPGNEQVSVPLMGELLERGKLIKLTRKWNYQWDVFAKGGMQCSRTPWTYEITLSRQKEDARYQ